MLVTYEPTPAGPLPELVVGIIILGIFFVIWLNTKGAK